MKAKQVRNWIELGANRQILEILYDCDFSELYEFLDAHYSYGIMIRLMKKINKNSNYYLLAGKQALDMITFTEQNQITTLYKNLIPHNFWIMRLCDNDRLLRCGAKNKTERLGKFVTFKENETILVAYLSDDDFLVDVLKKSPESGYRYATEDEYSEIPKFVWQSFLKLARKRIIS